MLKETLNFMKLLHQAINRTCTISIEYNATAHFLRLDVRWINKEGTMRNGLKINLPESVINGVVDESTITTSLSEQINNQIEIAEAGGDEYQSGLNKARHTGAAAGRSRSDGAH